MEQETKLSLG